MIQLVKDKRPMIIAIDFDGTLFDSYDSGDLYIETELFPTPLLYTLIDLKNKYNDCLYYILYTCHHDDLDELIDVCQYCGLKFDNVNQNYPYLPFETSGKVYADLYLDNRANGKPIDCEYIEDYISSLIESDLIRPFKD
jgi:hypothetical protein